MSQQGIITWIIAMIMSIGVLLAGCAAEDEKVTDPLFSKNMYMDPFEVHRTLEVLHHLDQNGDLDSEKMLEALKVLMNDMQKSDYYFDNAGTLSKTQRRQTVGVLASEKPIGGGADYQDFITEGDFTVSNADELLAAVKSAESGDVIFVTSDAKIDMTSILIADNYTIILKEGVTLASDRGHEGSTGGLIYSTALRSRPMFEVYDNVRVTGITIRGGDPYERSYRIPNRGSGISVQGDGFLMDNVEISGFPFASVAVNEGTDHRIMYSYIHHNRNADTGYGIFVDNAQVVIEYNLFNHNRISVYGTGNEFCAIEMRNNVEMGTNLQTFFHMDLYRKGADSFSGQSVVLSNNTFFSDTPPYIISDMPREGMRVANNWFANTRESYGEQVLFGEDSAFIDELDYENNAYDRLSDVIVRDAPDYFSMHTENMNTTGIMTRVFYNDLEEVYLLLRQLAADLSDPDSGDEQGDRAEVFIQAIREIEHYSIAYDYLDEPFMELDGDVYGVIKDDNPLGGGLGYDDIITTGDFIVETAEELIRALMQAREGDVIFIPGYTVIDLTTINSSLTIQAGVTLASDRGHNNSPGALIFSDAYTSPMFSVRANVRITGLVIQGADPKRRIDHHTRSFRGTDPPGHPYFYQLRALNGIHTRSSNVRVDNCELTGWSHAAIYVESGQDHHFHHNFFHHNQRHGLGYGVTHGTAYSIIEYNLLNFNRHALAATGAPGSGYIARHNLQMGDSLSHVFDVHGGSDRGDGTDVAGDLILMYNNTFLSDRYPYWIRGIPSELQDFYNNLMYAPLESYDATRLYGRTDLERERFSIRNNIFNLKDNPTLVP